MSAVTWVAETRAISPSQAKAAAQKIGFFVGLVTATCAAYAGMLFAVLVATSIIQF